MTSPEHDHDGQLDRQLKGAFSRLRGDASQLDTMAALRRVEGSTISRRPPFLPLVAGAMVVVAVVAGVVLGSRGLSTSVVTDGGEQSVEATTGPAPKSTPAPTERVVATVTPTPSVESPQVVAPTTVPTSISQVAPTPTDDTDVPPAASTPAVTVDLTPTSAPNADPAGDPTAAPITPVATEELVVLTVRGGPFVGTWQLAGMGGSAPTADSVGTRIQIFPDGELNIHIGCWMASGLVKTDSRLRLRVVSESLQLSSALCSASNPIPPDILMRIRELELAVLSVSGGLTWEAAPQDGGDGYQTRWQATTGTVLNGGGPSEPFGDLPLGVNADELFSDDPAGDDPVGDDIASSDTAFSDDIRAFAGPWRLVAVDDTPLERSDLTLHLSTTGDLTLSSSCHEYIGRVQTSAGDGLSVVPGSYNEVLDRCTDDQRAPLPEQWIADVENARTAVVADEQLRWTSASGVNLVFERE